MIDNADSSWELRSPRATLQCGPWKAIVDLSTPERGVHGIVGPKGDSIEGELLGLDLAHCSANEGSSQNAWRLADLFIRGDEMVGVFEDAGPASLRLTASWRVISQAANTEQAFAVELLLSLATDELGVRAGLPVESRLTGWSTVHRLGMEGTPRPALNRGEPEAELLPDDGPLAVLVEGDQGQPALAQMVHPAASCRLLLSPTEDDQGLGLRYGLFDWTFEKGVTLRARLRGILLPNGADTAVADAWYEDLLVQPPTLSI